MTSAPQTTGFADRPGRVDVVEVGARDGLQNEDILLETAVKVDLVERTVRAGSRRVEVASFVHPERVPQMGDAESVTSALGPSPAGSSYIGLVLNRRGLERAFLTPVDEINFVVGASRGFNEANAGVSPDVTMGEIESMIPDAGDRSTTVTISVAFGCPYEGTVPVADVVRLAEAASAAGAHEIALGDTIGVAVPDQVLEVIAAVREVTTLPIRCHFHDTRNTAVANVVAAYSAGIRAFDASVGGAGGCPFAPNASGNLATEDLLYLFDRMGVETGIDPIETIETAQWLGEQLGRDLPGAVSRAGWWPADNPVLA